MSASPPLPEMKNESDTLMDSLDYEVDKSENVSHSEAPEEKVAAIVDPPNEEREKALVELEEIKQRACEMAEEQKMLQQVQVEVKKHMSSSIPKTATKGDLNLSFQKMLDSDNRSVFVGNVDYKATTKELEHHFNSCGFVTRATILSDKYSGLPKGFAYVEFADKESAKIALTLNDSLFRGRQIQVEQGLPAVYTVNRKRTNLPGISTTDRAPRGRFFRGARGAGFSRGRGRGSFRPTRAIKPRGSTWHVPR